MAEQVHFNKNRAWDANGDPSPGAKATFFESGTSTPLTVYSDEALTTPHASPLVANAQGIFAPVYVDGTIAVKVNVTDSADATLSGYPVDPVILDGTVDAETARANLGLELGVDVVAYGGIVSGSQFFTERKIANYGTSNAAALTAVSTNEGAMYLVLGSRHTSISAVENAAALVTYAGNASTDITYMFTNPANLTITESAGVISVNNTGTAATVYGHLIRIR